MSDKEFVLHDGLDDAKTEELHKFLNDADKVFDWEGSDSGITLLINVDVYPGDTIVIDDRDNITVRRKA